MILQFAIDAKYWHVLRTLSANTDWPGGGGGQYRSYGIVGNVVAER